MKRKIILFFAAAVIVMNLSACFVHRDHHRHDRDHHDEHRDHRD